MKWRLFICSDCDSDEGVLIEQWPDDYNHDAGARATDYCPGCGSYLSMVGTGEVEVAGLSLVHLQHREPAVES
jgi:hypothetical protein